MKGLIYKIVDNTNNNTYYGSTIQKINHRMNDHRECLRKYKSGKKTTGLTEAVKIMINEDYYHEIVEEIDYNEKVELLKRERWWIENNECINKVIPTRTNKEFQHYYYEKNKERISEQGKKNYQKNKDKKKQNSKEYYEKNKDEIHKKRNVKVKCECGVLSYKFNLPRHKKTQKHLIYLDSINAKSEVSKE
tara:strand:+ start:1490 stop:2062 length:573 start_codon:yes stop_codon:yes gene_type:complete